MTNDARSTQSSLPGARTLTSRRSLVRSTLIPESEAAAGVGNNHKLLKGNLSAIQNYRATVRVERIGEMTIPTDVLVHFADGREVTERWDGLARSRTFTYEGPARVEWAKIDPQQQNLMDVNLANNSFTVNPSAAPAWKYTVKFLFWTQNLMQWLSMLA